MSISILLILLLIIYLLASLVILVFFLSTIQTMFFTKVPFIHVPNEVMSDIIKALDLKDNSVVYDLGCGDARVLVESAKSNSKAKFVGIELVWLALALAKIKILKAGKSEQVKIYSKNFFETDLSEATHVFLYLFPKIMDKLLPKLEKELKPGSRIVSVSFRFTSKEPKEIINLNRRENQLAREIFVYEF